MVLLGVKHYTTEGELTHTHTPYLAPRLHLLCRAGAPFAILSIVQMVMMQMTRPEMALWLHLHAVSALEGSSLFSLDMFKTKTHIYIYTWYLIHQSKLGCAVIKKNTNYNTPGVAIYIL